MSKRVSPEFRILSYFREEELEKARAILGLAAQEVKAREPQRVSKVKKAQKKSTKVNSRPVLGENMDSEQLHQD